MSEERKDLLKKVGIVLLLLLLAIGSFVTIFTVATRDEEPEEEAPIVEVLPEKEDEEPENKITSVPKPEFTDTSFVYDGKEHSPDVKASAFYAVSFKSSTTKAKDAGSYKIVYKLNNPDDVKWEDGTTDDIICESSIEPKEVGLKWGKTKFAFDGKEHSTTCVISGVLEGDKCDIVLKNNSIIIDNNDYNNYTKENIDNNITYVSQNEMLFTDSLLNNLKINRKQKVA